MTDINLSKIEKMIYLIRGQKVMLDADLAELYEVKTKRLNEQVKRNIERFPEDFMFQLLRSFLAMDNSLVERVSKLEKGTNKLFRLVFERLDVIEEKIEPRLSPNRKRIGLNNGES